MKKKKNNRFQIQIDTDSILISQAPGGKKSRVLLTNISEDQLKSVARHIIDAELQEELIMLLKKPEKAFR